MAAMVEKFLTMRITEAPGWVSARCSQFGIGTFAETAEEAECRIYDNVKAMSYVLVEKKRRGDSDVDDQLFTFANIINNNGANVRQYFDIIKD